MAANSVELQASLVAQQAENTAAFLTSVSEAQQQQQLTATKLFEAQTELVQLVQADAAAKLIDQDWQAQINASFRQWVTTGATLAASAIFPPVRIIVSAVGAIQFIQHAAEHHGEYVSQADGLGLQGVGHTY